MISRSLFAAATLAMTGCMAGSADAQIEDIPARPAAGQCDAEAVQIHLGERANQTLGARILEGSGASILRWGPPNSAWTMDYREDRVNVRYDEEMIITAITCG